MPRSALRWCLGTTCRGRRWRAIALWVTIPHHFVTWLRVYGSPAEFARFKERFILGPIVLVAFAYGLIQWAPLSLVLIVTLWDHQHSLMQQYGFARVYDFKAKAGTPATAKFDLAFNWIFFGNMLVVSPLFSTVWVRMLHEWHLPIGAEAVETVHLVSWTIAVGYGLIYVGHIAYCAYGAATRSILSNTSFCCRAISCGTSPVLPRPICSSLRWRTGSCTGFSTSSWCISTTATRSSARAATQPSFAT